MSEKKAFVFDTNFIIQNQRLDEVVKNLEKDFSVYVTQVSIDERIAQQCRELKSDYENIEKSKQKYSSIADIKFKLTYESACEFYKKGIQKIYEDTFPNRVIPFKKTGDVFCAIIDRANKKLPPFSDAKDASDKGFKDCLLWFSLVDFFKSNGEDEVVFVTDDKNAFRNKTDFLCKEFMDATGKNIEFKLNSFYKDHLLAQDSPIEKPTIAPVPENLDLIREEIETVIKNLCIIESEDFFGNPQWERSFTTSLLFDKNYVKSIFDCLQSNLNNHLFEKTIPASIVFDFDGRISDDEESIPIENLEKALSVYNNIVVKYPDYINQFFIAVARILNRNYVPVKSSNDDDLPF